MSPHVTLPRLLRLAQLEDGLSRESMPNATPANQGRRAPAWRPWKRNPQTLPHCVWITGKSAMLSKFVFSHLLTRLLLSKSPSAHPMICFQGRSRLILNGWFITPSLRLIVEPCHLNFRTPIPFLFTFCLPSALLQMLLWGDAFCSLRVWLL